MADAEVVTRSTHTTTTTTTTTGPAIDIGFDLDYLKSVQGILKVVEILLSLIAFSVMVSEPSFVRGPSHNFFIAVAIICGFTSLVIFFLLVTKIIYKLTSIPWNLVLAVAYIIMATCYTIGFILVAANALTPSHGSAATLGCIASVVYFLGMFFAIRDYRAASNSTLSNTATEPSSHQNYAAESDVYDPKY